MDVSWRVAVAAVWLVDNEVGRWHRISGLSRRSAVTAVVISRSRRRQPALRRGEARYAGIGPATRFAVVIT